MRESRIPVLGVALLWVAGACLGCGGPPELSLCTRTAPDDADPLHPDPPADQLVLRAVPSPDGLPVQKSFEPQLRDLSLPALTFGTYRFVVQALRGEQVVATGRTPLAEVTSERTQIPCLYVATVGVFGDTTTPPPPGAPRHAFASHDGTTALIATEEGLLRYDHLTGELSAETLAAPVEWAEGAWADAIWADLGGGDAAVIARDGHAAILTESGEAGAPVDIIDPLGPLDGVAAVGTGPQTVLLVGGATDASTVPGEEGSLRVLDLADGSVLPLPGGLAVRDAHIENLGNATFVVLGGNGGTVDAPTPSGLVAVVDPACLPADGCASAVTLSDVPVPRRDPIVAVTSSQNVLVFGGRDAAGALSAAVERYRVAGRALVAQQPPGDLEHGRAGGIALVTGDEIVIAGGETDSLGADGQAERFSFTANDTISADAPGVPLRSPVSADLFDGTRLVVGREAAVVYRP